MSELFKWSQTEGAHVHWLPHSPTTYLQSRAVLYERREWSSAAPPQCSRKRCWAKRRERSSASAKERRWGSGAQERSRSKPFSIRRRFFLLTRLLIFEAIEASDARSAWQLFTRFTLIALEVAVASEPSFHSTGVASSRVAKSLCSNNINLHCK